MPVSSGSTFTGYTVLRPLGRGDSGEVFLAQHPRLPHWSALKILSTDLAEDGEFRDRFMRETAIATSLYHPHILGVEYRGLPDAKPLATKEDLDINFAKSIGPDYWEKRKSVFDFKQDVASILNQGRMKTYVGNESVTFKGPAVRVEVKSPNAKVLGTMRPKGSTR